ncbi:hypothetical protein BGZ65_001771 [Modicella reniformis]|uniref:FAD-binding domain-containing protein n=1 Tax=Modicella reniformis TaxID=1440133 RepID=A0A9P6SUA2_9FUNG|nr:hypothetical protein BGZ65_001771 [Modicella reniformis]
MPLHPPPKVLIAGAGLGGLFLAILLEKAGIPYHIYERTSTVKPLGASMGINANILPVFDQLDLLKDLQKIAFACTTLELYKESLKKIGAIDLSGFKEKAGYHTYIFHRPDFYELLLTRVPREKISFNKKVVWVLQNKEGVMIRTSDNETHHGDILVGADGAYSAVRQNIYKDLTKKGELPASDAGGFKMGFICMVGTTNPLDPEEYPELKDDHCHFKTHIGKNKAHSWVTTTLPNNRISFIIAEQLDEQVAKDFAFRNSEWSSESNAAMIKQIYNFPIKHGREGEDKILGNLIDATDPGLISKIFLEEKLFETWYHGRTVLIGDAAHKMQPSAGQGAVNAMEDAVILANCLYDISGGKEPVTPELITKAFRDYREQRYCHAKFQVENSQEMAKLLNGQKLSERVVRTVVYNLPRWIMNHVYLKQAGYRPQVMFLPTVPNPKGLPVVPQKPSKRYQEEQTAKNGSDVYLDL